MAEAILDRQLKLASRRATVQSAGTAALAHFPADAPARELMQARGLDISPHRASQMTHEHTRWAELILVMEEHHRASVLSLDPTARGKTFLLAHWTAQEIPDPYRQGEQRYAQVLGLIDNALENWVRKIACGP